MPSQQVNITTIDNPFDPFDEFDKWFDFDIEKGYYTCNKLCVQHQICHLSSLDEPCASW